MTISSIGTAPGRTHWTPTAPAEERSHWSQIAQDVAQTLAADALEGG